MSLQRRAGKGRRPRVHFFSKMSRACSERTLFTIAERCLGQIQDDVLANSLRLSFEQNTLHLWEDWCDAYQVFSLRDYTWLRQVTALRSKSDDIDLGIDRERVAWEKYCESELACRVVNRNLDIPLWKPFPEYEQILLFARRKIAEILGDCPTLGELGCKFGPGANVSCRSKTTARHKLSAPLGASLETRRSIPFLREAFPVLFRDGLFELSEQVVLEDASLEFVPKNAKTDRTIEIQPLLNTFVQLGIGSFMKRRLVNAGINLYDQGINQNRARVASLTTGTATLDFSSASDRIARNLIRDLLPFEWFSLLEDWRCGTVRYKNLRFETEKFSAMGNGYTFELESVIFYALTWATFRAFDIPFRDSDITIFGDDLICPAAGLIPLGQTFEAVGFKLNSSKSFADGPFRESCGGDFLHGVNVRPCYIKSRLTQAALVTLHNFFYRRGEYEVAATICDQIDGRFKLFGPDLYGDGHLLGDYTPQIIKGRFGSFTFATHVAEVKVDEDRFLHGDFKFPAYKAYLAETTRCAQDLFPRLRAPSPMFNQAVASWFPNKIEATGSTYPNLRGIKGSKVVRVYAFGP